MKYDEYLQCAQKHLRGCASLLVTYEAGKNNNNYDNIVWLELYYLAGYIIEGITIYSAYKLNGWNSTDDIQKKYNLQFTKKTKLDFYVKRTKVKDGIETIPSYFQHRPAGALNVQQHKFQEIVKNILRKDPTFNDIPYLGNGIIDSDVEKLIDEWEPGVRYYYSGQLNIPHLTQDLVARLISTCWTIYIKHI